MVVLIFTYQELYCSPGCAPPRIGAVLVGWGCLVPMWGRSRMNFNAHTDTILFEIVHDNMICVGLSVAVVL